MSTTRNVRASRFRVVDMLAAAGFALALALQGHVMAGVLWAVVITAGLRLTGGYAFPRKQGLPNHLGAVVVALTAAVGATSLPVLGAHRSDALVAGTLAGAVVAFMALHAAWWTIIARGRAKGSLERRCGRRHRQRPAPDRVGHADGRSQCAGRVRRPPGPRAGEHHGLSLIHI